MIPKIIRGAGFRGALNYVLQARELPDGRLERPPVIGGNMSGRDARALAGEFAAARRLRPDVKRPVWHCPLSLPPGENLNNEKFAVVAEDFMRKMGFTEAHPWTLVLHREKAHLHAHIVASRIALDGSLWHGQNEARRAIEICRELEKRHGLRAVPLPPESKPGDRRTLENAARRAERKGEKKLDYLKIKSTIDAAIQAGASSPENLAEALLAEGYRAGFTRRGESGDGEIQGWRIADATADGAPPTSIKASSIHRDLAWAKIEERLAANRPAPSEPERAQNLADAAKIALARIEAGEINIEKLAQHLEAGGVGIEYFRDEESNGEITGWRFMVGNQRAAASSLDPRLGWGHVQMGSMPFRVERDGSSAA